MEIINLKEKNIERGILSETYHVVPFFSNGHLVRVKTEDDILLHGFLNEPDEKTDRVFVFIHGAYSNFYEGGKNQYLESAALSADYAYLAVNTRGHDFYARQEIFSDCVSDIEAWMQFCEAKGYKEVVLCGSSLGTHKVIYYLTQKGNKLLKKIILLAVSDNIGVWKDFIKDKGDYWLTEAKKLIDSGKGKQLMPEPAYAQRLSAQTYYDRYHVDSKIHIWDFHDPKFDFSLIKKVHLPTLVVTGSKDFLVKNHQESMKRLEKANPLFETKVIEGADHFFTGKEDLLKKVVKTYLEEES